MRIELKVDNCGCGSGDYQAYLARDEEVCKQQQMAEALQDATRRAERLAWLIKAHLDEGLSLGRPDGGVHHLSGCLGLDRNCSDSNCPVREFDRISKELAK